MHRTRPQRHRAPQRRPVAALNARSHRSRAREQQGEHHHHCHQARHHQGRLLHLLEQRVRRDWLRCLRRTRFQGHGSLDDAPTLESSGMLDVKGPFPFFCLSVLFRGYQTPLFLFSDACRAVSGFGSAFECPWKGSNIIISCISIYYLLKRHLRRRPLYLLIFILVFLHQLSNLPMSQSTNPFSCVAIVYTIYPTLVLCCTALWLSLLHSMSSSENPCAPVDAPFPVYLPAFDSQDAKTRQW
ncbi:uncharacterized protein J3D65DRAFT_215032 [Phyllosticta citribraziliensis]|uniref:Uncharacterized protein n=1 Tax=Phyllosticta citribraziliensis TaxID=989973 RepID=A0ABR1M637_9PEZI